MTNQLFTMNHIGINFPDLDAAVSWYRDVLGCFVLAEPTEVSDDGTHIGDIVKDIFGDRFGKVRIAHLTTACGVGIEMFQFVEPKTYVPENTFDYNRSGIFHICLTTADIDATADLINQSGGKVLSKRWQLYAEKNMRLIYCRDPWGTIIEFYEAPYAQFCANRGIRPN
jgi:catechol 2,3-dioxygenase-like lactoylglutathione lyase family enzyme